MSDHLTPLERRWLFSRLYARWIQDALNRGYEIEQCEVGVLEQRHGKLTATGERANFIDRVHKGGSRHYDRCAADPIVWARDGDGAWRRVERSDDPVWEALGELWESYHPLCHNGRRYGDANHLSLRGEDGSA